VIASQLGSAECGAECGEATVKRRVGTRLKDDVAFCVEDESAHVCDDGPPIWQEHAEDQADVGFRAYESDHLCRDDLCCHPGRAGRLGRAGCYTMRWWRRSPLDGHLRPS
jgi:hypothetical protein